MLKKLLAVSFGLLLVLGAHAASVDLAPGHPDTYVVKRGDTLWDIAGRFLKRPWLWPEIWQANPQIANPHLIYPGDVLSLAYLGEGPELSLRRVRREALDPIETIPLSAIESYLRNLRIMSDESLQSLPYVVGLEEDRLRGAAGHVAYARGIPEARPGDLYAIVRPTNRYSRTFRDAWDHYTVRSEGLDRRGEVDHMNQRGYWYDKQFGQGREADDLGWEVMQLTTAQVTRSQGAGIDVATLMLADEGDEVREGDRLMPVQPQPFDLYFRPHAPPTVAPYGLIRVLAVSEALSFGGPNQVMAISAGSLQGIDPGTVFSIWREGDYKPDNIVNRNKIASREDRVRLPDEFAGHAMVFRNFDQVSYALIMDSIKPTHVGYHLKHPDATR